MNEHNKNPLSLSDGTFINGGRYQIVHIIGAGGFGITYKAMDVLNHINCAIKEYVPLGICIRKDGETQLQLSSMEQENNYKHGKMRFLEEAETLKNLSDIPGIVHIVDYFEENNTAYYCMDFLEGVNMKQLQAACDFNRVPISIALDIIMKVGESLHQIHVRKGMIHRDISPENIFFTVDNQVKLIDFGSAKHMSFEHSQQFSVVLKPGYAPIEQYSQKGKQGSYTDVYALAGTLYYFLTGKRVPNATDRLSGMSYPKAEFLNQAVSKKISNGIEKALVMDYRQRTQTVKEFLQDIGVFDSNGDNEDNQYEVDSNSINKETFINPQQFVEIIVTSGSQIGQHWVIPHDIEVTVGRSVTQSNIVISGNSLISKKHCKLLYKSSEHAIYVYDMSVNGTRCNERTLAKNTWERLEDYDTLLLADMCKLKIQIREY